MLFQLSRQLVFPDPALSEDDGLLALGGDLSTERLLLAYHQGIFPWYAKGEPILWYSPPQRFVLEPKQIHISHSMQQLIKSDKYEVRWNTAFEDVIQHCSKIRRKGQHGTWIHRDMIEAYIRLHQKHIAQSLEVWDKENLVGGLYGVSVGKMFCGESMFSLLPNTSKLALIALCNSGKYDLIDCQVYTPHLERMGAKVITRNEFMGKLERLTTG